MKQDRIPIDTAATMFASLHHKNSSRVYRLTAEMKDGVDPAALKAAVRDVAPRFPMMTRRVHKGFFSASLDYDADIKVLPDTGVPAKVQWIGKAGGPDIRVLYYKSRIAVEVSHALTDANALTEFLKAVIARYLILNGADPADFADVRLPGRNIGPDESENAFERYYQKHGSKKQQELTGRTYRMHIPPEPDVLIVTAGLLKTADIKSLAAPLELTVTEYLASLMIYACIKTAPEPITDTVRINIPLDLRKRFPSGTLRNFVSEISVSFCPKGRTDVTVKEIAGVIRGQIRRGVSRENLQAFINRAYSLANNPVVRAIPLFIMDPVLRGLQLASHVKRITISVTNIGDVALPPAMAEKVGALEFVNGSSAMYGQPKACAVAGCGGYVNISFSNAMRDLSLAKIFFRHFTEKGIQVKLTTSDTGCITGRYDTTDKFCPACGVHLHPQTLVCPLCRGAAVRAEKPFDGPQTAGYSVSPPDI